MWSSTIRLAWKQFTLYVTNYPPFLEDHGRLVNMLQPIRFACFLLQHLMFPKPPRSNCCQVGFTTDPVDDRSTMYTSDVGTLLQDFRWIGSHLLDNIFRSVHHWTGICSWHHVTDNKTRVWHCNAKRQSVILSFSKTQFFTTGRYQSPCSFFRNGAIFWMNRFWRFLKMHCK